MMRWSSFGNSTGNTFLLKNSSFTGNLMGPSLWLWSDNTGTEAAVSKALVTDCHFYNNNGTFVSGGIAVTYTRTFDSLKISSCTFYGNSANAAGWQGPTSAIGLVNYMSFLRTHSKGLVTLENLTVTENFGSRHAVSIGCDNQLSLVHVINITMMNNQATALGILNCALKFSGVNKFINNTTPFSGGALIVNGSGYAYNDSIKSSVIFMNNRAAFGGALYSSSLLKKDYMLTVCTFLNLNTIFFVNNTATVAGDNIYGGLINDCLNIRNLSMEVNGPYCHNLHIANNLLQSNTSISSDPYQVFLCDNDTIHYKTKKIQVEVYPGRSFIIPLVTGGLCSGLSPGVLEVSSSHSIHIVTDTSNEYTTTLCQEMSYTPLQTISNVHHGTMNISIANCDFRVMRPLQVDVHLLQCPHGMKLSNHGICICDQILTALDSISCNISLWPYPIVKYGDSSNYWLSYNEEYNCTITSLCPLDYCITKSVQFNLNNQTNLQCDLNKTGTLCGQCQYGLSLQLVLIHVLTVPVGICF